MYISKLRQDEQFQEFAAAFALKIKKKPKEGKVLCDPFLYEQLLMLKGEAVFGASMDGAEPNLPAFCFSAAMTDAEYKESLRRGHWIQSGADTSATIVKSSFQEVEMIQRITQGGTSKEEIVYWAHLDRTFLLSDQRAWVEECIVRLKKEQVVEPTGNTLDIQIPAGSLFLESILQKKKTRAEKMQAIKLHNALGLRGIGIYRLHAEVKGNEILLDSTLAVSDLNQGLFSLLDTSPRNPLRNGLPPRPFSSFMVGKINLANFWKNLPEILTAASTATTTQVAMAIRSIQQKTGLDIEQDVLAHLGNQFVISSQSHGDKHSWVIALELRNEHALEQSLGTLFASPMAQAWGNFILTSDFRGHVIYSLKPKDPEANPFTLSTANGQLLFGHANLVQETIQQLESGIQPQPSEMERTARKHTPANAFGFGATDQRKAASLMYIKISDSAFSAGLGLSVNKKSEKSEKSEKEELGENEISLNYMTSFLQNVYYFTEAVPGGIHHRIVLEYKEIKGVES